MNTSIIWIGVIPVLAFAVIDAFTERRLALLAAFAMAAGELVFTIVKFGTADYLTMIAFGMVGLFILISLKTGNDFYFKIQGAVINVLLALVLLGARFLFGKNILLDMMNKYLGLETLMEMNPLLNEALIRNLLTAMNSQMPWWFIAHSALTMYAAWKWHKWVWVVIRVPGFYFMLFLASLVIRLSVSGG